MSAMAPERSDKSRNGRKDAVCTKPTICGEGVSCVIAQAAPTPWINTPKFEARLASQMRRKAAWPNGARIERSSRGAFCSRGSP